MPLLTRMSEVKKMGKIEIGDFVTPKVSIKKGIIGTVVSLGKNPKLPVAVAFDETGEWDFKETELNII